MRFLSSSTRRSATAIAVVALLLASIVTVGPLTGDIRGLTGQETPDLEFQEVSSCVGFDYTAGGFRIGTGANASVYTTDVDRDGWTDLFVVGGEEPRLFKNVGGEFEPRSIAGIDDVSIDGAMFFDHDNDGWEDLLLVPTEGAPVLLENERGSFDVREDAFDSNLTNPIGATAADYDRDGVPEVFVIQHGEWDDGVPAAFDTYGNVEEDNGNPNVLFDWNGSGYEHVDDAGIDGDRWSFAASFVDLTGDGWPDIHVANDFNNDTVYVNQGDGTFKQRMLPASTDRNGMSSEIADVNGDRRPDVFVTNIYLPYQNRNLSEGKYERLYTLFHDVMGKLVKGNNLLINTGNGTFDDRAAAYGVKEGGWGWAAVAADFDNDMDRDLFHTTSDVIRLNESDPHFTYPMVWERTGDGFLSRDASELGFLEGNGRGTAALDYDNDGDVDLAVANFQDEYRLYENRNDHGTSIEVRVRPGERNHTALGAQVSVTTGNTTQYRVANVKSDYQSQDTRVLHFGTGSHKTVDELRVVWPDGSSRTLTDVATEQRIVVSPVGTQQVTPLAGDTATPVTDSARADDVETQSDACPS